MDKAEVLELLRSRFSTTLAVLGVEEQAWVPVWESLVGSYSEPHRYYHTLDHLYKMIVQGNRDPITIHNSEPFYLAIFFHDVAYIPGREDNEEESARIAASHLRGLGVEDHVIIRVEQMILATKGHGETTDPDTRYLLDLDLHILGGSPDEYDEYAAGIRKEFQDIPTHLYNRGRKAFLVEMLNRNGIFHTDWYREHFTESAKRNIKRELDRLE